MAWDGEYDPRPDPDPPCAVVGCKEEGRPQICPYDGQYHRHGCIHYDCGHPESKLRFRKGWHWVCDEHYRVLREEREAWSRERKRE